MYPKTPLFVTLVTLALLGAALPCPAEEDAFDWGNDGQKNKTPEAAETANDKAAKTGQTTKTKDKPENDKNKDGFGWGTGKKKTDGEEIEHELTLNPELSGTYMEMARVCTLTKEQQEKLVKLQKVRDEALEKWDKSRARRIEAAEKRIMEENNEKRRVQMRKQLDQFMAPRDKLLQRYNRYAFKVLDKKQTALWYGNEIWLEIQDDILAVQPPLEEDQTAKVKELCNHLGSRLAPGVEIKQQPAIKQRALRETYSKVMNSEQKKSFAEIQRVKQRLKEQQRREARKQR